MIEAKLAGGASSLAARLTAKAKALTEAHGENLLRSQRGDAARWREARLLWPLFSLKSAGNR